jgi:hypothetical protein
MVNSVVHSTPASSTPITTLVRVYVGIAIATLAALTVLSVAGSPEASEEAWVHAVIVSGFAVLLPLRARAAQQKAQALTAVGVIAAVLVLVNGVEALIPGLFPVWMRVEMAGISALMAALGVMVVRARRYRAGGRA